MGVEYRVEKDGGYTVNWVQKQILCVFSVMILNKKEKEISKSVFCLEMGQDEKIVINQVCRMYRC